MPSPSLRLFKSNSGCDLKRGADQCRSLSLTTCKDHHSAKFCRRCGHIGANAPVWSRFVEKETTLRLKATSSMVTPPDSTHRAMHTRQLHPPLETRREVGAESLRCQSNPSLR